MNSVILIGNLTRDPELRYTEAKQMPICKFTIAVNDSFGKESEPSFIPVTVFGKQAESCERFLYKGSKCAVKGRIKTGSYEGKNGKVNTTEVIADQVEFLRTEHVAEPVEAKELPPEGFAALDPDEMPF